MLSAFVQKIADLAKNGVPAIHHIDGHNFIVDNNGGFAEIVPDSLIKPRFDAGSLDQLVNAIKGEIDAYSDDFVHAFPIFVNAEGYGTVNCYETVVSTRYHIFREHPYRAMLTDVPGFAEGWMDHDKAMIALQCKFQPNEGTEYLLGLLSRIATEGSVTSEDNGISQQVTVHKGVSLVGRENVRPIVKLKPYRTFWEIDQPESEFLVRVKEGGQIGLFEADGGAWKYKARKAIAEYLKEALAKEIERGYVVVSV